MLRFFYFFFVALDLLLSDIIFANDEIITQSEISDLSFAYTRDARYSLNAI